MCGGAVTADLRASPQFCCKRKSALSLPHETQACMRICARQELLTLVLKTAREGRHSVQRQSGISLPHAPLQGPQPGPPELQLFTGPPQTGLPAPWGCEHRPMTPPRARLPGWLGPTPSSPPRASPGFQHAAKQSPPPPQQPRSFPDGLQRPRKGRRAPRVLRVPSSGLW